MKDNKEHLLKAVELLEKASKYEKISKEEIEQFKKDCGLIVDAEMFSLGIVDGGFYGFKMEIKGREDKYFYCDPDDLDFYNYCIPIAMKMDKDFVSREKRLKAKRITLEQNEGRIVDIDDAVKPVEDYMDKIKKLTNSLSNNNC